MPDTCETCRFWSDRDTLLPQSIPEGVCRRGPPKFNVIVGKVVLSDGRLDEKDYLVPFPPIEASDWCGEHQPIVQEKTGAQLAGWDIRVIEAGEREDATS